MSQVLDPTVIDPPGFNVTAAWGDCKKDCDEFLAAGREIAASHCADPGICACPNCDQMYWAWGRTQRCAKCLFEFPTDAWAMYSWGVQAAWRTGGKIAGGFDSDRRHYEQSAYFRYGFHNPISRAKLDAQVKTEMRRGKPIEVQRIDLHDVFKLIDWRAVMYAAAAPDLLADQRALKELRERNADLLAAAEKAVIALRQLTREGIHIIDLDNDLVADALAAEIAKVRG